VQRGPFALCQKSRQLCREACAAMIKKISFDFSLYGLDVKRWVEVVAEYYDSIQSIRIGEIFTADCHQITCYSFSRLREKVLFIEDRFPTTLPALKHVNVWDTPARLRGLLYMK
jgi:hypothetical protein